MLFLAEWACTASARRLIPSHQLTGSIICGPRHHYDLAKHVSIVLEPLGARAHQTVADAHSPRACSSAGLVAGLASRYLASLWSLLDTNATSPVPGVARWAHTRAPRGPQPGLVTPPPPGVERQRVRAERAARSQAAAIQRIRQCYTLQELGDIVLRHAQVRARVAHAQTACLVRASGLFHTPSHPASHPPTGPVAGPAGASSHSGAAHCALAAQPGRPRTTARPDGPTSRAVRHVRSGLRGGQAPSGRAGGRASHLGLNIRIKIWFRVALTGMVVAR